MCIKGPSNVNWLIRAVDIGGRELGMTQVDLVLLHHPCATAADNIGLWKGLEQALAQNLTRAIGVRGRPTLVL